MNKLPISVFAVIYNNEDVLDRCLASCQDFADEIIIIHDGPCSDRSIEIAKKYTDKIYITAERMGIPCMHRVTGLEKVSNDWVLVLDADEFVSDELKAHLPELINQSEYQGYDLIWPTLYQGHYYKFYRKRALFNKKFFYLIGAPSEFFQPVNQAVKIKKLNFGLEHRPNYDNLSLRTFKRKWTSWCKIHADYYLRDFSGFIRYNCPPEIKDWPPRVRIRINHPLLFGILGSLVFYNCLGIKDFIKTRKFIVLKAGFLHSLFHILTYYYVWQYKKIKRDGYKTI
ncbi:MAG: glycosyltransferase [Patescibacteria group bacterium]|jgi:glycosyltransferase involved in cell wall biosynthesis